ncbi:MAG: hypothetical protein JWR14_454 [Caballeronia sp.]|jgi:hypothetical protein|nr:hypothetical protein [Caballeronia sp.]
MDSTVHLRRTTVDNLRGHEVLARSSELDLRGHGDESDMLLKSKYEPPFEC